MPKPLRIVFLGTPDFAVPSLDILKKNNYNIVGVVTSPDKPSGRGLEIHSSPIKAYGIENGIKVFQPEKLKDEKFLADLKKLKADLFIVVAFRMLPNAVWNMPSLGTFNLHASLLPQYRGAAPINWAIINGEKETGVTTFFLQQEIDTGRIILQDKTAIDSDETAGDLHDRLMIMGADLVLKTVKVIESGEYTTKKQSVYIKSETMLHPAPKLFRDNCKIDWRGNLEDIHNFVRGLSPYPCAWTEFVSPFKNDYTTKIYKTKMETFPTTLPLKTILTDKKTHLKIVVKGGFLHILEIQVPNRKKTGIAEFLRGYKVDGEWHIRE
jgi:methionyl-tRNA formyltransferase